MLLRHIGFTLVELLVVISIIALLMAVLLPALAKAREQAKRVVCMSGIRQLTVAWGLYADTYNDKIVNVHTPGNGDTTRCEQCPDCPAGGDYIAKATAMTNTTLSGDEHYKETPWVGGAYKSTGQLPEAAIKCAVQTGALYRYVPNFKLYRCPTADKGQFFTYNAMCSMNGSNLNNAPAIKNRNEIKNTTKRIVFMDEGKVTPDDFVVNIDEEKWWDPPEIRHSNGQVFSFVDGHTELWKWCNDTITFARDTSYISGVSQHHIPVSAAERNDLYRVQKGCWGKFGPTSVPVTVD